MYQASKEEARLLSLLEQEERRHGYNAHALGIKKTDNPGLMDYEKKNWLLGWETAEQGHEFW